MGASLHLLARRRFLAGLALLVAAASAGQCTSLPAAVTVQLLAINDFHGHIEAPVGGTAQFAAGTGGGEFLAAHIARAIAENPASLVVGAGDLIGASPLVTSFFHEEPTVLALNAMHMAVSSLGNHEFDKGTAELLRIQRGGCHPVDGCQGGQAFPGAAYDYLAANVVRQLPGGGRETLFPATSVRTIGGVRVGFIGEVLKETPTLVQPAGIRDLTFLDEAPTANQYAAELKKQGVNAIVLLIHQGGRQGKAEEGDPNACANFRGDILPILDALTPDIKVVMSGHAHGAYTCTIAGRTVVNSGAYGYGLERLNLTIDRRTDEILSVTARNEAVTRDVPPDPAESAILARYRPLSEPLANRPVGSVATDLSRKPNEAGESSLGDIIADAQLSAGKAADARGADVAFMNPGGIRAALAVDHPGAAGDRGQVTYGMLYTVQPFSNTLYAGTMTGTGIKDLLEQQFHGNGAAPTFLQVSRGFSYDYRADAPAGQHVARISLNGKPVGPDTIVRFVASDFLFYGGDGFTVFGEQSKMEGAVGGDLDVLVDYFHNHSPVAAAPQSRISQIR